MWKTTGIGFMTRRTPGYGGKGVRALRPKLGAAGADEVASEANGGEVYGLAGLGSLDHGVTTHEHGYVLIAARTVEEKVAGLEVIERHRRGVGHLRPGIVGKANA